MLLFPNSAAKQAQREKQKLYAAQLREQINERDVIRNIGGGGMRGAGYNVISSSLSRGSAMGNQAQNEVGPLTTSRACARRGAIYITGAPARRIDSTSPCPPNQLSPLLSTLLSVLSSLL